MASLWSAGKPGKDDDGEPEDAELVAEAAEETEATELIAESGEDADAPDEDAEDAAPE